MMMIYRGSLNSTRSWMRYVPLSRRRSESCGIERSIMRLCVISRQTFSAIVVKPYIAGLIESKSYLRG